MRGFPGDFTIDKERFKLADWNPLLLAVAFKRVDIVRYFVNELKISLRLALRDPQAPALTEHAALGTTTSAVDDIFGLRLAVANRDMPMLQELWHSLSNNSFWNQNHQSHLIHELLTAKWQAGVTLAMRSSHTIFEALSLESKRALIDQLFAMRTTKELDEAL